MLSPRIRIRDISKTVKEFSQEPPSAAEQLRNELMPWVDLDEDQLEVFVAYVEELRSIGVVLQDERLQEALNGNPQNIEPAIQAVLEYGDRLREKHEAFEDQYHATHCLIKALHEGWKPNHAN
ncbi:MAG: hypothetical protein SFW36_04505 [Leptolyngbyaceae cyanobacterium bins.59]|nr:hypothetical protein [Leptolyngbyaceae cyanobacterium bins.59]